LFVTGKKRLPSCAIDLAQPSAPGVCSHVTELEHSLRV
jgi:hypothetical protein